MFVPKTSLHTNAITVNDKSNITQDNENVNTQHSMTINETDSEGNKLTEQQQKYFANSKVRDENGNLLVVYHGTENEFDTFDIMRAGKNGRAEGYGFYFTDDKSISKQYGKIQKESYLRLDKPLYDNKITLSKNDISKLVNALVDYEVEDGEIDWRDSFLSNYMYTYGGGRKRDYIDDMVEQLLENNDSDTDIVYELANTTGGNYSPNTIREFYKVLYESIGVDGNISKWETNEGKVANIYVSFLPNRSKYTTNKTPTENPDMRYSKKVDENYQKALDNNDTSAMQKIIDDEAMQWGAYSLDGKNPLKLYHGTKSFGFTKFDLDKMEDGQSIFLTDDDLTAHTYSNSYNRTIGFKNTKVSFENKLKEYVMSKKPYYPDITYQIKTIDSHKVGVVKYGGNEINLTEESLNRFFDRAIKDNTGNYQLYAKLDNPLVIDCKGKAWNHLAEPFSETVKDVKIDPYTEYSTRYIANYAFDNFYDSVVFKNIIDNGSLGVSPRVANNIMVVFDTENVKSADVVTYDDNGEVIPPSQRFSDSEDIRWAKGLNESSDYGDIYTTIKRTERSMNDFKGFLDKEDYINFKNKVYQLEREKSYMYGDSDFVRIYNEANSNGTRIGSDKLVCLKCFNTDGTISPYRVYEIVSNTKSDDLIKRIKELEAYECNERDVAKIFRGDYYDDRKVNVIRYDGESSRYYILRNGSWRKSNSYSPIAPREKYNGAGFTEIDSNTTYRREKTYGRRTGERNVRESRTVEEKELTRLTKENTELRQSVAFLKQELQTGHHTSKTQLTNIAQSACAMDIVKNKIIMYIDSRQEEFSAGY